MNGQRDTIFEIAKNMKIDLDEGQKFISENLDKLAIDLEQNSKKFSFPFFNKSSEFSIRNIIIACKDLVCLQFP